MKVIRTAIPDVLVFEPSVYSDERGFFMESFNTALFHELLAEHNVACPSPFVQDNHSCSKKGVLRGLHYQKQPYAQGKLVRVIKGAVYDVAVDIRPESPTYMKYVGERLDASNKYMMWIPEGFAHGFVALEDDTHFFYKTTNYYDKSSEGTILWSDPSLAIQWPDTGGYIVSAKDAEASPM